MHNSGMAGTASSDDTAAAVSSTDNVCLGCRITGTAALLGTSAYFYHERRKVALHKVGERRWLLVCAGAFAVSGLWRATTGLFNTPHNDASESQQIASSRT